MNSNKNESKSKIKTYHLILFSCLLGYLFVLNSNYVNEKRAADKINKENDLFFNKIISKRSLEENPKVKEEGVEENEEKSKKICSKGSEELNEYYKTGDLSKIGLEDTEIKFEDEGKGYIMSLINLAEKFVGENHTSINFDELEDKDKENITTYALHILPWVIFFIIAFLSIIGWIVCCFCCCCDCCCCCCCKKPGCKVPCFFFTYIFYALVVGSCIYGLSKSNKIFTGLANTECSLLKLLEQVIDGEIKQTAPRWIGISGINNLLDSLKGQINRLKDSAVRDLNINIGNIDNNKTAFSEAMTKFDDDCWNGGNYLSDYTKTFAGINIDKYKGKTYVLDIVKLVGHKDSVTHKYPNPSFLYELNLEYSEISSRTDGYVETSKNSFNDILDQKSGEVIKALDKAKDTLDKLKKPFDKINNKVGDIIVDYSNDIDDYGKMVVKLVFSILMFINIALAVLLLLICLCSFKACTDCCFFRCLCKCFTHIFWNILALMMILTFLVGSIVALVGKIGEDSMSLVSYIMSEENFESNAPLLLGELGDAKKYLNICLHGDGSLENEFDLGDSLESIENIDEVLNGLDNVTQSFIQIKENLPSFNSFNELIQNRIDFINSEFGLINIDDEEDDIPLKAMLKYLNENIKTKTTYHESWDIDGDKDKICVNGPDGLDLGDYKFHPSTCRPIDRDWIADSSDQLIKDNAIIVSSIVDLVKKLNDTSTDSFKDKMKKFRESYDAYLDSYIDILGFLKSTIGSLIGQIKDTVGDGQIFSFLNGKFIGTNIKIILKYLKYSLGQDLYTVGLCLIIVGCSLILSISSTILLIVIINQELEKNKRIGSQKNYKAHEKEFGNSEMRKFK